jgi:hypothetical protein
MVVEFFTETGTLVTLEPLEFQHGELLLNKS